MKLGLNDKKQLKYEKIYNYPKKSCNIVVFQH